MTVTSPIDAQVRAAREALDAHVRDLAAWHFDPSTGCPFWLDWAAKSGWDPRKEIRTFGDLDKFGAFHEEWLRGGPVARWVPKAYAGKPVYVFESDSAGSALLRISIEDFRRDYELFSATLPDEFFPKGADWLSVAPTGPRRLRLGVEHMVQHRGGICFSVDLDSRWVSKLVKSGRPDEAQRYMGHVIEQSLTLLRAHEVKCVFATPKLLEALCDRISLRKAGITGVCCDSADLTPQFHRLAREELCQGVCLTAAYANPHMGLAPLKPFDPADNYAVIYYPPSPRAVMEVVNPDQPSQVVPYGQAGRLRLTTLTREFYMPHLLEHTEADREPPCAAYPLDGIRNPRPHK